MNYIQQEYCIHERATSRHTTHFCLCLFIYCQLFNANPKYCFHDWPTTIDSDSLIVYFVCTTLAFDMEKCKEAQSIVLVFFSIEIQFSDWFGVFLVVVIFPLVFLFCFHVCSATSINQIKSKYAGLQSITNSNFDRVHTWMRAAPMSHRVSRMALCVHLALTIRHNFDLNSTQKPW